MGARCVAIRWTNLIEVDMDLRPIHIEGWDLIEGWDGIGDEGDIRPLG
jgi:hypothetical protein